MEEQEGQRECVQNFKKFKKLFAIVLNPQNPKENKPVSGL